MAISILANEFRVSPDDIDIGILTKEIELFLDLCAARSNRRNRGR